MQGTIPQGIDSLLAHVARHWGNTLGCSEKGAVRKLQHLG
jgi:hypothetical protein